MSATSLINRNVQALAGRTSMRLEPELWDALLDICRRENIALADLVQRVEQRAHPGGRTSAVRVYIVEYFRALRAHAAGPAGVAAFPVAE